MFDQKVSPLFQIILISVYFQIISGFFERVDEIPKVNELKNVRNKSEEVLDGLEWKRVDREFVKFGIRSDLKNIVAKRMIIKNEFFEKMEIKESKDSFDNRRSDRTARNGRMNLALDVDQSLQFNQQLNTTSDKKPKVLVQILQRIRRKAEKKSNREDKRKKENKGKISQ